MPLRSALVRFAIAGAAGALAASAAVTPATASEGSQGNPQRQAPRLYKGVVTANRLLLRDAPNRGGKVVRVAFRDDVVTVYCRTTGQKVDGDSRWYLLRDGAWAYGAARYIRDLGPTPRPC
ncbi:SH3 domain-containing protein [Streptomyces sp. NPDC014882]|uniref:SH3 domain-containing protein n=1 Tax=Streptomyces sp. NPDC014882 TaxID=3364927 RepID=UPI0037026BEF